jgi:uncharacterized protein with NRDE domain
VCLLVVASRVIAGNPLVIGANRDEYFDRPSTSMTVLSAAGPRILGGRDERSGGTWLAVNEHGVFAGLTNLPLGGQADPTRRSRGELPLALASHPDAPSAVEAFISSYRPADYNGAWLLVGDRTSLYFIDFTGSVPLDALALPPGLYVLENRALGEPSAKVDRVRAALGAASGREGDGSEDDASEGDGYGDADTFMIRLRGVLANHQMPEPSGVEGGPKGAANCVHLDGYGTRSSCLLRYRDDPATPPQVWVADGPPCTTPFLEVRLWSA